MGKTRGSGPQPGSGRKKGFRFPKSFEKEAHEAALRKLIAADAAQYYEAMRQSALGVLHLLAKAEDGTWQQVTDPAVMVATLNRGPQFYKLAARNPDVKALIAVFERLCGKPSEPVREVRLTVTERITSMPDAELELLTRTLLSADAPTSDTVQ